MANNMDMDRLLEAAKRYNQLPGVTPIDLGRHDDPLDAQARDLLTPSSPNIESDSDLEAPEQQLTGTAPKDAERAAQRQDNTAGSPELDEEYAKLSPESKQPEVAPAEPQAAAPQQAPIPVPQQPQAPTSDQDLVQAFAAPDMSEVFNNAQRQQAITQGTGGILKGLALMGSGAAGSHGIYQPNKEVQEAGSEMQKDQTAMTRYAQQLEQQKNDPNSAESKTSRGLMKKLFDIDLPENVSASVIEKKWPWIEKYKASQEATEARIDNAKLAADAKEVAAKRHDETLRALSGNKAEEKLNQQEMSEWNRMKENAMNKGGRAMETVKRRYDNTENIFATAGLPPDTSIQDIDKLSNQDLNQKNRIRVVEMAVELNGALSGSVATPQRTLDKLIPQNKNMTSTQVMDWFTSKLNPAQQAEAMKAYLNIAATVRDNTKQQIKRHYLQAFDNETILKKHPDLLANVIEPYGFSTSDFIDRKNKKQESEQSPKSSTVPVSNSKTVLMSLDGKAPFKEIPIDKVEDARKNYKYKAQGE